MFMGEITKDELRVLTGTCDLNFLDYNVIIDRQNDEINNTENKIDKLKYMAIEMFKLYKLKNGSLPKYIVYFRDSSDLSQEMVTSFKIELQVLKSAYKEVNNSRIGPLITCIFVYKETKTFFHNTKVL